MDETLPETMENDVSYLVTDEELNRNEIELEKLIEHDALSYVEAMLQQAIGR